jgi:hypothetical protein
MAHQFLNKRKGEVFALLALAALPTLPMFLRLLFESIVLHLSSPPEINKKQETYFPLLSCD